VLGLTTQDLATAGKTALEDDFEHYHGQMREWKPGQPLPRNFWSADERKWVDEPPEAVPVQGASRNVKAIHYTKATDMLEVIARTSEIYVDSAVFDDQGNPVLDSNGEQRIEKKLDMSDERNVKLREAENEIEKINALIRQSNKVQARPENDSLIDVKTLKAHYASLRSVLNASSTSNVPGVSKRIEGGRTVLKGFLHQKRYPKEWAFDDAVLLNSPGSQARHVRKDGLKREDGGEGSAGGSGGVGRGSGGGNRNNGGGGSGQTWNHDNDDHVHQPKTVLVNGMRAMRVKIETGYAHHKGERMAINGVMTFRVGKNDCHRLLLQRAGENDTSWFELVASSFLEKGALRNYLSSPDKEEMDIAGKDWLQGLDQPSCAILGIARVYRGPGRTYKRDPIDFILIHGGERGGPNARWVKRSHVNEVWTVAVTKDNVRAWCRVSGQKLQTKERVLTDAMKGLRLQDEPLFESGYDSDGDAGHDKLHQVPSFAKMLAELTGRMEQMEQKKQDRLVTA